MWVSRGIIPRSGVASITLRSTCCPPSRSCRYWLFWNVDGPTAHCSMLWTRTAFLSLESSSWIAFTQADFLRILPYLSFFLLLLLGKILVSLINFYVNFTKFSHFMCFLFVNIYLNFKCSCELSSSGEGVCKICEMFIEFVIPKLSRKPGLECSFVRTDVCAKFS